MAPSEAGLTEDMLLDGRVRLCQPEHGFRAGLDSVLLAAAVAGPAGEGRVLEFGCGVGAALLTTAVLNPRWRFVGVEREPDHADLARRNAAANAMQDRVAILAVDPLADPALDLGGTFDAAFCNPPFNARGRPPADARAHAHISEYKVDVWIKALANRLRGGAHLTLIHRAEALADILAGLGGRLGSARVIPVHPFAHKPAHRVLVRATKGSRAGLMVLPPLVLHECGAKHTPQAEAILRGRARVSWD